MADTAMSDTRPADSQADTVARPCKDGDRAFLGELGRCIRELRQSQQLSRKRLSERSGVSPRFIAQLECGEGNISIVRLKRIADVLNTPLEAIVALRSDAAAAAALASLRGLPTASLVNIARHAGATTSRNRFALVGLRGAGKSTLGRQVADLLGLRFVELNAEVERRNGLGISEIFALYGEERYRQLELECLDEVIKSEGPMILALGGGIVEQPDAYHRLLENFTTIWLRASPDEHMARVLAQGDRRPVAGHPAVMENLRGILRDREPAYASAHYQVDTSGKRLEQSVQDLAALLEPIVGG